MGAAPSSEAPGYAKQVDGEQEQTRVDDSRAVKQATALFVFPAVVLAIFLVMFGKATEEGITPIDPANASIEEADALYR